MRKHMEMMDLNPDWTSMGGEDKGEREFMEMHG
jgi:hypothetical protein